jgi:hypothetical protein
MGASYRARAGPWAQALAAIAATAALAAPARAGGPSLETAIKATYLYKFAPFIEWPEAGAAPGGPFVLCVVGSDPFGALLDRAVAGQSVDTRPIVVKRLDSASAQKAAGCQIMYLGGSPAQSVADAVKAIRGAPVLTVAEGQGAGAVIGFVVRDQRVRFVIDIHAAAENNLKISSKLLSLALEVQPGKP